MVRGNHRGHAVLASAAVRGGLIEPTARVTGKDVGERAMACWYAQVMFVGLLANQSLQQMKPPVTSLADASAAPDVFTAEARC